jgi:hypothetical protein
MILGKENCNGQKGLSEITDDDTRAMKFSTEEKAIKFYTTYTHFHGFAIRGDDVKHNHENKIVARRLLWNKEGKSEREKSEE